MDRLKINHVLVAGAGAWGTALAQVAASNLAKVSLLANEEGLANEINKTGMNSRFLPGVSLSNRIAAVSALDEIPAYDLVLAVCPAQRLRRTLSQLAPRVPVLICAKGIEAESGKLMSEVASDVLPAVPVGVLSGPSFAQDVSCGLPCAVTIAFQDEVLAQAVCGQIGSAAFRPYSSADVVGVAVGGAVKNVLAIACGIVEGKGLGESARAGLVTRGFAEMSRFGIALGAKLETMAGLSGLGDLVLTATSMQSRNFRLGVELARGLKDWRSGPLAEGAVTSSALVARAKSLGIEMPISEAVAGIIAARLDVDDAIRHLLARPLKNED